MYLTSSQKFRPMWLDHSSLARMREKQRHRDKEEVGKRRNQTRIAEKGVGDVGER